MGEVEKSAEAEAEKKGLSGEQKRAYIGGAFHRIMAHHEGKVKEQKEKHTTVQVKRSTPPPIVAKTPLGRYWHDAPHEEREKLLAQAREDERLEKEARQKAEAKQAKEAEEKQRAREQAHDPEGVKRAQERATYQKKEQQREAARQKKRDDEGKRLRERDRQHSVTLAGGNYRSEVGRQEDYIKAKDRAEKALSVKFDENEHRDYMYYKKAVDENTYKIRGAAKRYRDTVGSSLERVRLEMAGIEQEIKNASHPARKKTLESDLADLRKEKEGYQAELEKISREGGFRD